RRAWTLQVVEPSADSSNSRAGRRTGASPRYRAHDGRDREADYTEVSPFATPAASRHSRTAGATSLLVRRDLEDGRGHVDGPLHDPAFERQRRETTVAVEVAV